MKRKIAFIAIIFAFILNIMMINSIALTNDVVNGKLRVLFNSKIDGEAKVREEDYDNIVDLSPEEINEIKKNPIEIDYSEIDLYDEEEDYFDYFDINGCVNNEWKSTTYDNIGYFTVLKVNDNAPRLVKFNNSVLNNIQSDINTEFVYDGNYVKLEYVLKNIGNESAKISLGCFADIQIGENDCATVERIGDNVGIKMTDPKEDLQYIFYGRNNEYVTDIDRLWIGLFPEEEIHFFNQNNINYIEKNDTSYTFSWIDRTIEPGETKKFSVLIGVGKFSSSPVVEFDEEQENNYNTDDVKINVDIRDSDEDGTGTLKYLIDESDTEEEIKYDALADGKKRVVIDLSGKNLNIGKHHLKVYAVDSQGNMSNIIEKDFYISSMVAPTIQMNEEWSREDVKFKIIDNENNPDRVSKYQYKIGDGDWKDGDKNTDILALDKSGMVSVIARVIGTDENDIAESKEKTAKVDKEIPINSKMLYSDEKFSFTAQDTHSGVREFRYCWSEESNYDSIKDSANFSVYNNPFKYESTSRKDVFVHYVVKDNAGNEAISKANFPYPNDPEIKVEKELFKDVIPKFSIKDDQEAGTFPFIYEVQINDGEWQAIEVNKNYDVQNVLEGSNKITLRKRDIIGRNSNTIVKTFNYEKTKPEPEPTPAPAPTENTNTNSNSTNTLKPYVQNTQNTQNTQIVQTTPQTTNDSTKSYAVASNSQDNTTAKKSLPKAGISFIVKIILLGSFISAMFALHRYRMYKE